MAVALMAVLGVQTLLARSQVKINRSQQAAVVSHSLMAETEMLVRQDFDIDRSLALTPVPQELSLEGWDFDYEVRDTVLSTRLKEIEIDVSWQEQDTTKHFVLTTQLARFGE